MNFPDIGNLAALIITQLWSEDSAAAGVHVVQRHPGRGLATQPVLKCGVSATR
jgi:hypothetical protein